MARALDDFETAELRADFEAWFNKHAAWWGFYKLDAETRSTMRYAMRRAYYAGDQRRRMLDEPTAVGGNGFD